MQPLTDRDMAMLELERHWWDYTGVKEQAIRDRFDVSTTRYYQELNTLIDRPEAYERDPLLVKRLRRLRETRKSARSPRRLGIEQHSSSRPLHL